MEILDRTTNLEAYAGELMVTCNVGGVFERWVDWW